ncbi:unnamed protein product [Pedinophyceae sp. YPF-701]|nr:unnamed protein product [Pedinophyceae sp. YPF-701]
MPNNNGLNKPAKSQRPSRAKAKRIATRAKRKQVGTHKAAKAVVDWRKSATGGKMAASKMKKRARRMLKAEKKALIHKQAMDIDDDDDGPAASKNNTRVAKPAGIAVKKGVRVAGKATRSSKAAAASMQVD